LSQLEERRESVDTGKYNVLRVIVSFPGETRLNRGESLEDMDFYRDKDQHPIASLNMGHLGKLTEDMEPKKYLHL
ncbi:hypothetical protein C8J57DRAFT_1017496, partial [Mycena rebaudengoi]